MQSRLYKIIKFIYKIAFFVYKICIYQIKVVILHRQTKQTTLKTFTTMKAMTTKLSCEKWAQVISIKRVKGYWCVEQRDTKNLLGVKHDKFVLRYEDYKEALDQYISAVENQARHIALMSL